MKRYQPWLALAFVCLVAWLCVPSPQPAASQGYGPGAGSLKYFDEVFKTAATHDVVVGVANKRIRIIHMFVRSNSTTAVNVYFKEEDGSDTMFGTNSTDTEALDAAGISGKVGWVFGPNPGGLVETTTTGKGVQCVLDGAQEVAVCGTYVEVRN